MNLVAAGRPAQKIFSGGEAVRVQPGARTLCKMADYITVLSGEHRFRVRNPEEFEKRCREILEKIGNYDVEIDGDSASIFGTGVNFSLAEVLKNPESYADDEGCGLVLELRDLIEEYALEPWTVEEIGWEKYRYVTHVKCEIGPTKDIFIIALVEGGLLASTWIVEGTADLAIKTAKDLAAKLDLNPEEHDLAVERPFVVQPGRETVRNSERIWTWDPEEE